MAKFVEFDPLRAVSTYEDEYEGRLQVHYRQDVEPILELAKTERINGLADKAGKDQELFLYARIPPTVILKLKYEYGVDVFKRDHMKKAFELINEHFPYLKTTEKTHRLRH